MCEATDTSASATFPSEAGEEEQKNKGRERERSEREEGPMTKHVLDTAAAACCWAHSPRGFEADQEPGDKGFHITDHQPGSCHSRRPASGPRGGCWG